MPNTSQPVIKKALGENWEQLATIVKRHYDITPGEDASMTIKGVMEEVYHSNIAKLFLLPGRIFGALVPYRGNNIPTEVRNWTTRDNASDMFWHRTLDFDNKQVIFASRMEHIEGNEIIEHVRYGMGIRMGMSVDRGALVFRSKGYVLNSGLVRLPIPAWLILGDAEIIEQALSEDKFRIDFNMLHPLFGRTFAYSGTFYISESTTS